MSVWQKGLADYHILFCLSKCISVFESGFYLKIPCGRPLGELWSNVFISGSLCGCLFLHLCCQFIQLVDGGKVLVVKNQSADLVADQKMQFSSRVYTCKQRWNQCWGSLLKKVIYYTLLSKIVMPYIIWLHPEDYFSHIQQIQSNVCISNRQKALNSGGTGKFHAAACSAHVVDAAIVIPSPFAGGDKPIGDGERYLVPNPDQSLLHYRRPPPPPSPLLCVWCVRLAV